MTRNGKVARLPREIRDELNRRLDNGESGVRLVDWLNGLPEVQKILQAEFEGRPISEQNLSEWKAGGFRDWQARQQMLSQTRELAADAKELAEATDGRLTDHLATVLAARYAAALAGWDGEVTDEFRRTLRTLRWLCQDVVELRRGDHSGARLGMERERLERDREKTEEEVLEHFERWAENPQVRDRICRRCRPRMSPEEIQRRLNEVYGLTPETPVEVEQEDGRQMREIFGLPPKDAGAETKDATNGPVNGQDQGQIQPDQTESNQIKPNQTEN